MIYLISAPPRTGKTLKCMEIIFKHLNDGAFVFTNIIGINIPGVFTFTSSTDHPHDWRDLDNFKRHHPELSNKSIVVIYDEAHEHPAFADRNLIQDKKKMADVRDIGISLTLHGHFGFDIYLITQNPRLLAPEVLASISTHYIMRRKFGYDMATIFEFGEAKTAFSKHTAKDALVRTFWKYPKHLYKYYKSSEVHNVKKTFPLKYYFYAFLILCIFAYGFMNAKKTGFFGLFKTEKQTQELVIPEKDGNKIYNHVIDNKTEPKTFENDGIDCSDNRNMHYEKCQIIQKKKMDEMNAIVAQNNSYINYVASDPYREQQVQYELSSKPVFSGCVKYNGKYYAYTQQGTKISGFKDSDCKKLIEDGDRPFNYFANGQTGYSTQNQQPQTPQDQPNQMTESLNNRFASSN